MFVPVALFAHGSGPDFGYSGVPGEGSCQSCHGGGTGTGSVTVTFPGVMTYAPGVTQRRRGFQLTSCTAANSSTPGGKFAPGADGLTQLTCTGAAATQYPLLYIEHTDAGSRAGQAGPLQFTFDWTPPANAAGSMVVYVAANAANINGSPSGEHIYARRYTLTCSGLPALSANGVVNAAGFQYTISGGSRVAIQGTNLSATTRLWGASDFVNSALPQQLDGVMANLQTVSPGLFLRNGITTPSDVLYSTGSPVTVTIGSISASSLKAVLTPGNAGLYQIAVTMPVNAPAGDLPVIASVAGVASPSGVVLTVQP
jgi:hypothetical protein